MTAEQLASLGAYMQFERTFYAQQGSGFVIAKCLVELHGGTLAIASVPNQHTTVQVTLLGSEG